MRVALISDIHGNLFALDAALAAIEQQNVDRLICLGDVAAFGPQPLQVLARLQTLDCPIVMGNTDEWLLDPKPHPVRDEDSHKVTAVEMWAADQLTTADKSFIQTFKPMIRQQLNEMVSLLCFHGSPRSNTEIIRATTAETQLAEALNGQTATIMAGGHTHTQLLRRYQQSYIINPGSIGLPYEYKTDSTNVRTPPWAEYAILQVEDINLDITFHRARYDIQPLLAVVHQSGMPFANWWVQDWESN